MRDFQKEADGMVRYLRREAKRELLPKKRELEKALKRKLSWGYFCIPQIVV